MIRQCQTAAATESLLSEPGFHLSSRIPWAGNLDAHYILELPLYNFLVLALHTFLSDLTLSGKLTSILLWTASFLVLQLIWSRLLHKREVFWANFLFVVTPLGVFFGQAFMPEMLIQLLAFLFIWQILRYDEEPTVARWILTAAVGLLSLLVKLPEIIHLYPLLAFVLFRSHGWNALLRARYILAGLVTVVSLALWGHYVDAVNMAYLPEWTSTRSLFGFIGSFQSRFHLRPWLMGVLYISIFILPGLPLIAALNGMKVLLRGKQRPLLTAWLACLLFFYLLWFGNGATAQSYYNLPALAPLAALFGIGISELLSLKYLQTHPKYSYPLVIAIVFTAAIPVYTYLFKQDRQFTSATAWVKAHTHPDDIILFRLNHRPDMVAYPYNAAPAYHAHRTTFVWSNASPSVIKDAGLHRARFAVVTSPPSEDNESFVPLRSIRGISAPQIEDTDWLTREGFHLVAAKPEFEIFRRD